MNNVEVKDQKKNDYKKTSVGYIPTEWEIKKLKDVVRFLDEKRKPIKASERAKIQGKYPYYGASGIIDYVDDYIFDDDLVLLGEDGANILNRSSPLAFKVSGKCWVNNHAHVLKPKKNAVLGFVKEYLESIRYEKYNTSTAQPKLNKSVCKGIPVPVPPLKEQEKISEFLSTWDEAIFKTEKLITAKKRYKKGLMQRLLSGKVRFPEFEGEDWVEVKLGDIAEVISSNLDKKIKEGQEDVRLCNYMDVYDNAVIDSSISFMESTASEREIEKYTLKEDDVIITKDSETADDIANAAVVKNLESRVLCGYHLAIIRPNRGKVLGDFLAKQIMTFAYRKQFFQRANGATRYGLRISDIESAKFNIPTLKEQMRISSLLNSVNKEISILNKEKLALEKQKKGLMQQLLTGKVRVNNIEGV